jgi:hypothetical protein
MKRVRESSSARHADEIELVQSRLAGPPVCNKWSAFLNSGIQR